MVLNTPGRARHNAVLSGLLLIVPLGVALSRGPAGIGEGAYAAFHIAEMLVEGHGFPYVAAAGQPQVASPLAIGGLMAMSALRLSLPWITLVLGAAAWSLATLAVLDIGRRIGQPGAGTLAALVIAFSPGTVAPAVLATHVPWVVCLAWWATWSTVVDAPLAQTALLCGMLALEVDVATIMVAAFLLIWRWRRSGRWPLGTTAVVAVVLTAWIALARMGWVATPAVARDLSQVGRQFLQLTGESEFYWFLPLWAAIGVVAATRLGFRFAGPIWIGALLLSGSSTAWAVFTMLSACWVGLGVAEVAQWLAEERMLRLAPRIVLFVVGLLGVAPLLLAQTASLRQRRSPYTPMAQELLIEAATYVQAQSEPDEVVFSSARVGYLARRPTVVYQGLDRQVKTLSETVTIAERQSPNWCVSTRSLGWQDMQRTGWFQSVYFPVATFTSDYTPLSPVTVWQRRPDRFEIGAYEPLNVRLPGGRFWVGYRYTPARISPGDTVSVTLYTHEPQATEEARRATVYLRSPGAGGRLAQVAAPDVRSLALSDPDIGRVVAEHFSLSTDADLSVGAYYLSASVLERDADRFAQIYQDDLVFPIDRVTLGYVVVPWTGEPVDAVPIGANLGDRATLVAYATSEGVAPGSALEVILYWQGRPGAREATSQHFVFVHLLDAGGNLVAQHDGPPAEGRYPVSAWSPAETVPDTHTLNLDPTLPPGEYRLQAGMYTWPTLERLAAWDAAGDPLDNGVVVLGEVTVPAR